MISYSPATMARPSARKQILDSAERLFAERGLEAVSLRSINAEAGLSAAALHYHFGSKQALLDALLERRMSEPMQRRERMLDELERRGLPPSAREVLDVLVRPLAELVSREGEGGRRYVRLLSRLQADGDMLSQRFVGERFGASVARLEPLLQRALPDLPSSLVRLRLGLSIELLLRSLAGWQALATQMHAGTLSLDEFVESLLDFLTGALEAPSRLSFRHSGTPPEHIAATPGGARTLGEER